MKQQLHDVVIRFSGDSGDGMQLTGTLFSETSALAGNDISTFPDYPAEIRAPQGTVAGVSGFQVHFGSGRITSPGDYCDVLVAMNPAALKANRKWLKTDATVILDADSVTADNLTKAEFSSDDPIAELGLDGYNIVMPHITSLTRTALAEQAGMDRKSIDKCKNMFALGIILYMYNCSTEHGHQFLDKKFGKKAPALAEANRLVLDGGYNYAANNHLFANTYFVAPAPQKSGTYRSINGNVATAWGFIAASERSGRPLFCGSYPITPATVILEELAKHKSLGVKSVQAEDEIAGICTAIGAAYGGSLAITTTSGPGLSLKSEALGLAVMAELPLVVVDVQRGGPSTGLPTKTEQSDLLQALHGRNGECPLVVLAAASPGDCFDKAYLAAKIALEHMTPVVLLTDGFIANGSEPWRIPDIADYAAITPPIVESAEGDFMPYKRDERLVRGWALPGTAGLEHRIGGLEKHALRGTISYDPDNHAEMVRLRAEKVRRVADYLPELQVEGDAEGDLLVVSWGGTYGHVTAAVEGARERGASIAHCHISALNPLPHGLGEILARYRHVVVCELNEGQLAYHLRQQFPSITFNQYNKCEGQPFTTSELLNHFMLYTNR